jgi:hypothetical protein
VLELTRQPFSLQSIFNNKAVYQVNVPSTSGDFGILPNHVPVIATLKPGVVAVFENASDNAGKKYFGECLYVCVCDVSVCLYVFQ